MQAGWEDILDQDETILWQGRPDGNLRFTDGIGMSVFGVFFGGFAVFWMYMASSMGGGLFSLFGLPFLLVGAYMVAGRFWADAFQRRRTWYTLTNKRGFISRDLPFAGKTLKSYPVDADTVLDFRPGPPDSIIFAIEAWRDNDGHKRTREVGFRFIDDGQAVYRLMRDIQTGSSG